MTSSMRATLCTLTLILFALFTTACGPDEPGGNTNSNNAPNHSPADLFIHTEPAQQITAGETFTVAVELLNDSGLSAAAPGIDITVALNRNEFADGTTSATATTNDDGIAQFDLAIESVDTGLALTATSDHPSLDGASAQTGFFEIVAATADPANSSITGTDGTVQESTPAEITIVLIDPFGNPSTGVTPEFTASGDGNSYGPCTATDETGLSTCTMTSTEAGPKTLRLTSPIDLPGDTIEFFQWDCDAGSAPFGGGNGSTDNPYRLCTPDHLNAVGAGTNFLSDAFVLARDIDLTDFEDFNIIGSESTPFNGHFHGTNHIISHLTLDRPDDDYLGLFGFIGLDGVVEHLTLDNVDISGLESLGALAAENHGTISYTHTSGNVAGTAYRVGGLVGENYNIISHSSSSADVSGNFQVGGLVGRNSYSLSTGSISHSHATGDITGADDRIGGLVGWIDAGQISDSYATGHVQGHSNIGGLVGDMFRATLDNVHATGDISGNTNVGGLTGRTQTDSHVQNSYSEGNVTGHSNVGGLIGLLGHEIYTSPRPILSDSYATGSVESSGSSVGGLVGMANYSDIMSSYATGDVTGGADRVGGLVGYHYFESTITASHSTSTVHGEGDRVGGLVGHNEDSEITASYADGEVTGLGAEVGGLVGRSGEDSTISTSYAAGDVFGTEGGYTGGLVGYLLRSDVVDSYATGAVDAGPERPDAGGLVGFVLGGSITNAYASGLVTGGGLRIRGLVGAGISSTTLSSYWDTDTSQQDTSYSGDPLSTPDFADEANFTDWDFTDIWTIGTAPDGETRPILRWQ